MLVLATGADYTEVNSVYPLVKKNKVSEADYVCFARKLKNHYFLLFSPLCHLRAGDRSEQNRNRCALARTSGRRASARISSARSEWPDSDSGIHHGTEWCNVTISSFG